MGKQYSWQRIVAVILSVIVILYMSYNAFAYTYSPVTTDRLTEEAQLKQTFEFTGFVVRDEKAVSAASGGTVISLANDGKRVAKGDCIAISCADDGDAAVYTRLEAAKAEFARLSVLNNPNGVNALNSEKLNEEIRSAYGSIMDNILSGNYTSLPENIEIFNDKSATKQILSQGSIDLSEKLISLEEEIKNLESENIKYTQIQAPGSGYYINNLDGYETTVNYDEVSALTNEQISAAIQAKPQKISSNLGKLVNSYKWYIVGLVETDHSKDFPAGKNITVNFPENGLEDIKMKVESAESVNGKLKVTLSSTLMNETLANMRIETVQVVEKSYTGYKIPVKAIRFDKENNSGVYVLRGKIITFINVEIIHSQEEYVIVSSSKSSGSGLSLYDDVIIKGRDLYDGKVIN